MLCRTVARLALRGESGALARIVRAFLRVPYDLRWIHLVRLAVGLGASAVLGLERVRLGRPAILAVRCLLDQLALGRLEALGLSAASAAAARSSRRSSGSSALGGSRSMLVRSRSGRSRAVPSGRPRSSAATCSV